MQAAPQLEMVYDRDMTPAVVLDALADHTGAANGITARDLVAKLCGFTTGAGERHLRHVIEALRKQGHRICAHPSRGYFLAETEGELNETCEFLYSRAVTSFTQIAALKRVAMPDLRGQLQLPAINDKGEHA